LNHYSPAGFLYILLIAVLIVVRNLRPRRIKVGSLWISPTVISLLSIYVLPDTIYVGPSLAASLLWVVAFALRYWVRMSEHQLPILMALTDGLILFPPAAYVVMYWMIHRKYERLKGAPATNENAL
jgi:hypothetical protein